MKVNNMETKELKFMLIIVFLIVDIFLIFIIFSIFMNGNRTIKVTDQNFYIVQKIKEEFNIDYDIKEITFRTSFPDGYWLDIFDNNNQAKTVFDNDHGDSLIYDYFMNIKRDVSMYVGFFIILILIEALIFNKIKDEKYSND